MAETQQGIPGNFDQAGLCGKDQGVALATHDAPLKKPPTPSFPNRDGMADIKTHKAG